MSHVPYHEAIGSLFYARQKSKPVISSAVDNVSRCTQNTESMYWIVKKRIIR